MENFVHRQTVSHEFLWHFKSKGYAFREHNFNQVDPQASCHHHIILSVILRDSNM